MHRFLTACAEGSDWREIAGLCLAKLGSVPAQANLGFFYVTDPLADVLGDLASYLRQNTGVENWVGTVGLGIICDDHEYYDGPAAAIMLGAFPESSFRVFQTLDSDLGNLFRDHERWIADNSAHLAILHGDPRAAVIAELIPRLAQALPGGYLVGGLSSSHGAFPQYANALCEGGASGVLFSEQVPVAITLSQGCTPIGPQHTISEGQQNIIATLDNQPALEVFKQDIGEVLSRDLRRVGGYIFLALPIEGSDTGDYVVRNLLGFDPTQGQLVVGESVRPGQTVMFCRRDGSSAWEDLGRALQSLRRRITDPVKGALYFSCIGRGKHLFGEDSEELRAVQDALGDVPLVGFFANGEIAHDKLYGYTGVLTVFT